MTVTVDTADDVAEPDAPRYRWTWRPAERQALIERWANARRRRRLAEAEDLADAVAKEITLENTADTYAKSQRVRTRFCAATGLPEREGSRRCRTPTPVPSPTPSSCSPSTLADGGSPSSTATTGNWTPC